MTEETEVKRSPLVEFLQLELELEKLRRENEELRRELSILKSPPYLVCRVIELFGEDRAIVRLRNGNEFLTRIVPNLIGKINPGDRVFCDQKNLVIIEKFGKEKDFDISRFVILERPKISWRDIGGLKEQIREIREVVELPLKRPELFKRIGIEPPKGVLLYGPPGTGKTLLAKAVASSTNALFIEIVASELVQKYIGEGAKLVREIFEYARENAPSIIFIDELDAIAARRVDIGTSGEREVNRTFVQLLAELDGFEPLGNVKVIAATNRPDIVDPAILRPGRLDRLIEVPLPDESARYEIFKIHTRRMSLARNVDLKKLAKMTEGFSGADIKAVCTEAGYFAIRQRRNKVTMTHFLRALEKVKGEEEDLSWLYR